MSVPAQTPITGPYTANGNTKQFAYQFYLLQETDLVVYLSGVKKILHTDYEVTGIGQTQGGNVLFTVNPPQGAEVLLKRQTPYTRNTDYADNGDLLADVLNQDFDRLWLSLQEINANFGSSISRPVGGDWDADLKRITRVADGVQPQDAVTYKQLFTVEGNAAASAAAASQSASVASQQAGTATNAASTATGAASSASTSASDAQKWAANPVDSVVANGLYSARHYANKAAGSATNAASSESTATTAAGTATTAAGTATSAATTATQQADRATTEADKLGNMNALAAAIQSVTGNNVVWKGPQAVLIEGADDQNLVTVRQLRAATAGGSGSAALINGVVNNFIGAVEWWMGSTTTFPAGFLPASGQVLNRADYPELWAAINASLFPSSTETVWQATPTARGVFSTGDGSTTFRMPDLNGVQTNSIAALFLRGSAQGDLNSGGLNVIRENAAPNITAGVDGNVDFGSPVAPVATNAFTTGNVANATMSSAGSGASAHALSFNASRASAAYGRNAATEVRPNSIKGTWIMRVNGSFTAANTNFSVLNGAATAPANGVTVSGGVNASKYQVAGVDYVTAELRAQVTGGATPARFAALDIGDGTTKKTWGFGYDSSLATPGNTPLSMLQPLTFSAVNGRKTLVNAGVAGSASSAGAALLIPISDTTAFCIQSGSTVVNTGSDGRADIALPKGLNANPAVTACSGDPGAFNGLVSVTHGQSGVVSFNVACTNLNGSTSAGAKRVNWTATGIVNL